MLGKIYMSSGSGRRARNGKEAVLSFVDLHWNTLSMLYRKDRGEFYGRDECGRKEKMLKKAPDVSM